MLGRKHISYKNTLNLLVKNIEKCEAGTLGWVNPGELLTWEIVSRDAN